jgi:hypothetical protein
VIILFTGVIVPDYLIPKVISDYLSIAFREKLMITVAKRMIILVIIRSLATPYTRPHKLFKSFLKLPCCIFTVAERKQSKAVISFEEWNWKSCSAALQFRTPLERFFLLFKSRTSSALQFYSESQGRANGRNCNWRLQFGMNMSKCKYTYMYFPLYKQVVLSEETVFNEGEGIPIQKHSTTGSTF